MHARRHLRRSSRRSAQLADIRRWMGRELTAENGSMLYAPMGCAHGYLTLEDDTEVTYFTSAFYSPEAARGIRFDDPLFDIAWPRAVAVVSEQDSRWTDFDPNGREET